MDFALIMFVALVVTGVIWIGDHFLLAPRRVRAAETLRKAGATPEVVQKARQESVVAEYARAFFPVILIVFLLRSFLVEPFRIPSGSMMPGLLAGDFILVNKFTYGLRIPVINLKAVDVHAPQRGDVMVFRYPHDTSINYIKRVIGLPGDRIVYRDRQLTINDRVMAQSPAGDYTYSESGAHIAFSRRMQEKIDGVEHDILLSEGSISGTLEITVPEGHYFVMGDNRDRSNDSRAWGMVPEANIVGRAFLIWFSWDTVQGGVAWKRIGNSIH